MRRLSKILKEEASQRVENKSIVTFHVHQMAAALRSFSVALTNPMSPKMRERGKLAREVLEGLMGILRTAGADSTTPQATSPESNEGATTTATTATPHKGAKALTAGPAKILGNNDAWLSAMPSSINELHDPSLSSHGDQ